MSEELESRLHGQWVIQKLQGFQEEEAMESRVGVMAKMQQMQICGGGKWSSNALVRSVPHRVWPRRVSNTQNGNDADTHLKTSIFFLDSLKLALSSDVSSISLLKLSITLGLKSGETVVSDLVLIEVRC